MAHDGYSRNKDPPPVYNPTDSHLKNPQSYYANDGYKSRSRQTSTDRGEFKQPQEQPINPQPRRPIAEAVTTAFDDAHVNGISQEIMAQITQSVIEQLKKSGTLGTGQGPPSQQQPHVPNAHQAAQPPTPQHPPPQQQYYPPPSASPSHRSDGTSPPAEQRNVYTPPSPQKHTEQPFDSPGSKPTVAHTVVIDSDRAPEEKRRPSDGSDDSGTKEGRPKYTDRLPSSAEETTLEKIWGPLFDEGGKPTARLSQFLRGLAVHLIEDYEPKHSLVVTPNKMAKFYENVKIPKELYPWQIVFDDEQSSISRMYRKLRIQHHLTQEEDHLGERPDIPGLPPKGFERWATLMILAHPEEEFERMKAAALNMPINNPDDKKERFPKDISRRLFPKHENLDIRELLIAAMEAHAKITVDRPMPEEAATPRAEQTQPPRHQRRGSDAQSHLSFTDASVTSDPEIPLPPPGNIERQRNPYSKVPEAAVIDDTNPYPPPPPPSSKPIERERKPYSVAPGGTRVYDDPEAGRCTISNSAPQSHPPPTPSGPPPSGPPPSGPPLGLHRSTSTSSRPINIPPPPPGGPSSHRLSMGDFAGSPQVPQMPQTTNPLHKRASVRRRHSPSASVGGGGGGGDYRRSDGDVRSFQPGSYEPPSHLSRREGPPHHPPPSNMGYEDDARRYGREGEVRRGDQYMRGGSPNRNYNPPERRNTYNEEDYYRVPPRREPPIYR